MRCQGCDLRGDGCGWERVQVRVLRVPKQNEGQEVSTVDRDEGERGSQGERPPHRVRASFQKTEESREQGRVSAMGCQVGAPGPGVAGGGPGLGQGGGAMGLERLRVQPGGCRPGVGGRGEWGAFPDC